MNVISRSAELIYKAAVRAASFSAVRGAARLLFSVLPAGSDRRISFPGYSVYARTPDRIIAALLCRYSMPSSLEAGVYRSRVKPGMTVVEIGANLGFFTLLFSGLAGPSGRVLAFEPDPENFRLLEKSVAENGRSNISCRRAAVSDSNGVIGLYLSSENRGDHRVYDSGEARDSVQVQAVTLDSELPPGTAAGFIKMDIQGAEFAALLGMERVISESPSLTMLCEFTPALIRKAGRKPEDFLSRLEKLGFRLAYLDEASRSVRSASPEELLDLCRGDSYVNLLLEKE